MKVLYIGGAGRSGSTLLELILGNLPGFVSVGEMRFFFEYANRGDAVCGCGVELFSCPFWSAVKEQMDRDRRLDLKHLAGVNRRLNRTRNVPLTTVSGLLGCKGEWAALVSATESLYLATWQVASCELLVDASKVPSHLSLLHRASGIDLRVLHLVRDGRAVAYSWSRRQKREPGVASGSAHMPRRSALQAILAWAVENALILGMCRTVPHTVMRYEDFVEEPQVELSRALTALGFGNADVSWLDKRALSLHATHSVGGNPIRFSRRGMSISADNTWCEKMPRTTRVSLGLIALPILARFGYGL